MGAVIGGLYASGYKIDELEKLALGIDWQQALSDAPPREDVPFRRKQDDRDFLVKQKLSFRDDGSLGLPLGVIQGQNLALLLESMFAHTSNTRNFDKLPIPFRAVATDITTGEKVVFSKGHLPQVIRASMSIPAVFAPVELDGRLLVDGGMTDNIPLDVAREMGVDIAIVVDIGTPLRSRKQLATVVDVLNQSTHPHDPAQLRRTTQGPAAQGRPDPAAPGRLWRDGLRSRQGHDRCRLPCHPRPRRSPGTFAPRRADRPATGGRAHRGRTHPGDYRDQGGERLEGQRRRDPLLHPASRWANRWNLAACRPTWAPCMAWITSSRCNTAW